MSIKKEFQNRWKKKKSIFKRFSCLIATLGRHDFPTNKFEKQFGKKYFSKRKFEKNKERRSVERDSERDGSRIFFQTSY